MRRRCIALAITALAAAALVTATVLSWPERSAGGGDRASSQRVNPTDTVAAGRTVFTAKGCGACHLGPDPSESFGTAPPLINVASRVPGMSRADYVRQSILTPRAVIAPGGGAFGMPVLAVSAGELNALVTYLTAAP